MPLTTNHYPPVSPASKRSRPSESLYIQFDNVSSRLGVNSRLRYIPRAGQEGYFVLNHGKLRDVEDHSRFTTEFDEFAMKASYTFRF